MPSTGDLYSDEINSHSYLVLDEDDGWTVLEDMLAGTSDAPISSNVITQLKNAGAKTVIIENGYLDKDFTDMFSRFYSLTFKRHTKVCKRLFIFDDALDLSFEQLPPDKMNELISEKGQKTLISVIVVRPVEEAPINSIASNPKVVLAKWHANLLIKAKLTNHILGASIDIVANEMTQQDQRVGSCAQASIWGVTRHIHNRHKGPWVSIPEITEHATSKIGFSLSQSLPTGSDFLPVNDIAGALKALGTVPYGYSANVVDGKLDWANLVPQEIINRYLDSGIPLIVGIQFTDSEQGHSVVATGRVRNKTPQNNPGDARTFAEFYTHFLINDDQNGPNLFMPINNNEAKGPPGHRFEWEVNNSPKHINIDDNVNYIIVPLPSKVYLLAEKAEDIAWDLLKFFDDDDYEFWLGTAEGDYTSLSQYSANFRKEIRNGNVIARTYLTYGWKYKERALKNNLEINLKYIIRDLELPRYVWVTEFGTFDSLNNIDPVNRRIFSHAVIDATAKNSDKDAALLFHAPGYCAYHKHHNSNGNTKLERYVGILSGSEPYFPKKRGASDFSEFYKKVSPSS